MSTAAAASPDGRQPGAGAAGRADLAAAWRRLSQLQDTPDAPLVSLRDPETALLSRPGLQRAIEDRAAAGDPRGLYVAALGVEKYARLRSVLGDGLAGQLMRQLAARLAALPGEADVARLNPETAGLAFWAPSLREAVERAEAARTAAAGVYALGEHRIDVRVTGGLSLGGPPAALVSEAELALESARANNRPAAVFDAAGHAAAAQGFLLMPELRHAIAHGGLHLEHQPKFDLRTRSFAGVESLVRWAHPRLGAVSPDMFVGMAEETGDIGLLTEWVLERAVAEQAALAAAGHRLAFAVNLSGRLVGDSRAIDALLLRAKAAQGPLGFEITETAVISQPDAAAANLERLAAAGHAVSIDDYGAGLSSLGYLKRIRAHELKLDRSLLADVTRSRRDALLLRSTIDLAHALGMKVVAEGVEDEAALALLAGMGCDLVQGWLISRAMPFARLRAFLDEHRASQNREGAAPGRVARA